MCFTGRHRQSKTDPAWLFSHTFKNVRFLLRMVYDWEEQTKEAHLGDHTINHNGVEISIRAIFEDGTKCILGKAFGNDLVIDGEKSGKTGTLIITLVNGGNIKKHVTGGIVAKGDENLY